MPTKRMLDVPAQMVLEIAYGVEQPERVAEKFGFSPVEWEQLKGHDPFVRQVDEKKAELKASGYSFRMKAAIAAEDLLEDVYKAAKEEGSSFHTKLESVKFFARAAGLDQPVKQQQDTGPAFSITINLGNGQSVQVNSTPAQQADPEPNTYDHDDVALLGLEIPEYLLNQYSDNQLHVEI